MPKIEALKLGLRGVIVDLDPLEQDDNALLSAQNFIASAENGISSIRKRPGLVAFTTSSTAGAVLGGIDLPVADHTTGARLMFIGRGPA